MEVPDLVVGNELVWKTSKGTSYDVKLLRVHDKKPTDGGKVKEARVRQEEDSPPSSSEDGSHQDYITTTDKPDQSQKDATSVEDSSNHSLTVRKKTTTDKPDKAQKGARSVEDDGDHHSNVRKKTSTDQPDQAQKSNTLSFGSLESEDESPVRKKRRDVHDSEMTDFSAAFQNLKHLSTMNETLKEIRDMMKAVMDSKTNSSESLQPRNANAEANEQMDHFLTEDGIDLLSIKAVDPAKYALNLMNALFTDEEMGSSCFKKRLGSKTEKPQLSPKRVGLLEASEGSGRGRKWRVCWDDVKIGKSVHSSKVLENAGSVEEIEDDVVMAEHDSDKELLAEELAEAEPETEEGGEPSSIDPDVEKQSSRDCSNPPRAFGIMTFELSGLPSSRSVANIVQSYSAALDSPLSSRASSTPPGHASGSSSNASLGHASRSSSNASLGHASGSSSNASLGHASRSSSNASLSHASGSSSSISNAHSCNSQCINATLNAIPKSVNKNSLSLRTILEEQRCLWDAINEFAVIIFHRKQRIQGKAPPMVARFLAGGTLIALTKLKDGSPPQIIRPIAVGESLRRLTGKCICALIKDKASDLFQPLQLGVACSTGSEKIIHGLRNSIEDHWMEEDFVVFKIDMQNAFNLVSRQAVLDECATSFPELLPWVTWCYGTHPLLWHQLGHLSSETAVQQGDPLGPLLFSLVLQRLISSIDADDDCIQVLFQAWYLDDGVLTGRRSAVLRALSLIEELGPSLGTNINLAKCELFSHFGNSMFPPAVKFSHHPNLEILGAPIDVAAVDPHVALSLLRLCGSYCRLVHLARATPSSLAGSLKLFDEEVRRPSFSSSSDAIPAEAVPSTPVTQRSLSKKLECYLLNSLLGASSMADRARLLSVSASQAASWLSMTPSLALGLHLEPNELHASIRWWLGLDTSGGYLCPVCSQKALDPLGHHATTCTHGGDVVTRHNLLRDVVANLFHQAHIGVTTEAGYGLTHDNSRSRPANVLVTRWKKGFPAALDITVISPLNPAILDESCSTAGSSRRVPQTCC
eukprot:Em0058g4a